MTRPVHENPESKPLLLGMFKILEETTPSGGVTVVQLQARLQDEVKESLYVDEKSMSVEGIAAILRHHQNDGNVQVIPGMNAWLITADGQDYYWELKSGVLTPS